MMATNTTGGDYAPDAFRVRPDTRPEHLRRFVRRRTRDPYRGIEDVLVFNYSTHSLNLTPLHDALWSDSEGVFVVPCQIPTAWPVMVDWLPESIREAPRLIWDRDRGTYEVVLPFVAQVEERANIAEREELAREGVVDHARRLQEGGDR